MQRMPTLRKSAFVTLAIAVVLPFALFACLRLTVYLEFTRRGLHFEGKGAVLGYLLIIAATATVWAVSAGLYLTSLAKERHSRISRGIEAALFVPLPLGLWWAYRLIFPA